MRILRRAVGKVLMIAHRLLLAALVAALPSLAPAATVTITMQEYEYGNVNSALTARDTFMGGTTTAGEDFEGFAACPQSLCASGTISSGVGSFTGYGTVFSGGLSQVEPKAEIVVRNNTPKPYGRFNVAPNGGTNWLDSNDREGIMWSVLAPGSTYLKRIAFLLTDLDDVNKVIFSITVMDGSTTLATLPRASTTTNLGDGKLHLVTLFFAKPTDDIRIKMINGPGDGFGIDGVRVAAVPLPAGGVLLLAALGGLALLRRRRTA
jgi:hypothetical protein